MCAMDWDRRSSHIDSSTSIDSWNFRKDWTTLTSQEDQAFYFSAVRSTASNNVEPAQLIRSYWNPQRVDLECQTSPNRCEKVATVEQRVQFQVVNICQHLSTFETFRNHPEDHPVFSAEVSHVSKASDPDLPRPPIWAFDRKFTGPEGGNRGPCARSSPAAWCFMMFQSCKLVPLIKKNF